MIRINKIFSKDGKVLSEAEKMVKPTKKIDTEVKTKAEVTSK
jgi:large subunit ribosomal protein L21